MAEIQTQTPANVQKWRFAHVCYPFPGFRIHLTVQEMNYSFRYYVAKTTTVRLVFEHSSVISTRTFLYPRRYPPSFRDRLFIFECFVQIPKFARFFWLDNATGNPAFKLAKNYVECNIKIRLQRVFLRAVRGTMRILDSRLGKRMFYDDN